MKHLLLLHGAIGSKQQLDPLKEALLDNFAVYSINFSGHGGDAGDKVFSIQLFAEEVLNWMKARAIDKISIFGYSMGGYVGLYLARYHPEAIDSVITFGTKLHWNKAIAAKETAMLNPATIEQKVPGFAEQLAERHHPSDWKEVLHKTAIMLQQMGESPPLKPEDYELIHTRVLLMLGDRDKMVSLDETVYAYHRLREAQLAVLPNTPHSIENAGISLLIAIKKFLQ